MKEIGGYIELDSYQLPMLHEGALALNCGRNCLAYLIRSRGIRKLKLPYFLCSSIFQTCDREGVERRCYHIGPDFMPRDVSLEDGEWLYLANYYGQLSSEDIRQYTERYERVIVDQAHGYFEKPLPGTDTFYTCRKWFGVADGAFLYTSALLPEALEQDESFDRMRYLLGRYERPAPEFYGEYVANNSFFVNEPIKRMSKLTCNLLHGLDYEAIEKRRAENFSYVHERLGGLNQLKLKPASFMYPLLLENGAALRKKLLAEKIYIPTLWPAVFEICAPGEPEYTMAENILPLPIDQRYGLRDMEYLVSRIRFLMEH